MGFRFRMEKLLRLRRLAEEESVRRLGLTMHEESACRARVEALQDGCRELSEALAQPLPGTELALVLELLDQLSRQLQKALAELVQAQARVERQRQEARRRMCDRQAIDHLEQGERERYRREQSRAERRRLDEAGSRTGVLLLKIAEAKNE